MSASKWTFGQLITTIVISATFGMLVSMPFTIFVIRYVTKTFFQHALSVREAVGISFGMSLLAGRVREDFDLKKTADKPFAEFIVEHLSRSIGKMAAQMYMLGWAMLGVFIWSRFFS